MRFFMEKRAKIFFVLFFCAIAIAGVFSFYKYIILKDYYVTVQSDCDPSKGSCFVYSCTLGDDGCTEELSKQVSYYKYIRKKANLVVQCGSSDAVCPQTACVDEEDCENIYCDPSIDGDLCSKVVIEE